jgi:acyl transferase domain-containing protein
LDEYVGTGSLYCIAANRISYAFDLRGPSLAVDTACSSSVVAVHLACESLRRGESHLALAAGVNLILSPTHSIRMCKSRFLAPDGKCKAFDHRANGFVRGEGVGVVVLKPLARALADNNPIYAVIRGSAVNQDGRSNGLTAPSPKAQEEVLRTAYRSAGVSSGTVQYVEAHGTGTSLGDPIEAKALGKVLAEGRAAGDICAIGSVKTNIGHLEAAAGIAGVIKLALSIHHGEIPPSLHFESPNPLIPFGELPLRVQSALGPWPRGAAAAIAGVSSFGIGGTNAHVVMTAPPPPAVENVAAPRTVETSSLLVLSARSAKALRLRATALAESLSSADAALTDVGYTTALHRGHLEHRLALVASSKHEAIECLRAFGTHGEAPGIVTGYRPAPRRLKLAMVFSGHGSQWPGMGKKLAKEEPAFRAALEECCRAIAHHADFSLEESFFGSKPAETASNIAVVQPSIFAVQVALAALWRSWGIEPTAVVGQSMGEVAAAHVAGALSLDAASKIICLRSRLMRPKAGLGTTAYFQASAEEMQALVDRPERRDRVSIAVWAAPGATVLSGDEPILVQLVEQFNSKGQFARVVNTDVAFHSPHMDSLHADMLAGLGHFESSRPILPLCSTVTGTFVDAPLQPAYWWANLRDPVRFSAAIEQLVTVSACDVFLEVSPHPLLTASIEQCLALHTDVPRAVMSSIRRNVDERADLLRGLGALYVRGHSPEFRRLFPSGSQQVRVPSYTWDDESYWVASARTTSATVMSAQPAVATPETARAKRAPAAAEAPPASRAAAVDWRDRDQRESYVQRLLARALRLPSSQVDLSRSPLSLGLDSLMAMELRELVESELGISLPLETFLSAPSVSQLAAEVGAAHGASVVTAS